MMRRTKRNVAVLAGWLFADLALMLSFVFLDSSAQGQAGPIGSSTTTTTVVSPPSVPPGVVPKPRVIELSAELRFSPRNFVEEVETRLEKEYQEVALSDRYLVVMIRIGSKGRDRKFASVVSKEIEELLKNSWGKIDSRSTYFDRGDDEGLAYGLVQLKLFPIIQ